MSGSSTVNEQPASAHTRLSVRNFAGYAAVVFGLGMATVGFGAVDLAMIAPKGVTHVAAVGEGDLLAVGLYSFFQGSVDAFSSRLAVAEGAKQTVQRLSQLLVALVLLLLISQLIGSALALGTNSALQRFGQSHNLVPLVGDYVRVRANAVGLVIVYWASNEALKICGAKNLTFLVLGLGFLVNATLDWVFLYTSWGASVFATPESAVATATVAAQAVMAAIGVWMFARLMRSRHLRPARPGRPAVAHEFRVLLRLAAGVGVRDANDYVGSIVPVMLIGSLGVPVLAAALVATKIYTLYCRVPQACIESSFIYYGYQHGTAEAHEPSTATGMLLRYAAVPTALATVLTAATTPWLVDAFYGSGADRAIARSLVLAYMIYVPAYFAEQFLGKLLVVHNRGAVLFGASTLVTYALVIPMAWYSVHFMHSAFAAVACKGIASAALAAIFFRTYRRASQSPHGRRQASPMPVGAQHEV